MFKDRIISIEHEFGVAHLSLALFLFMTNSHEGHLNAIDTTDQYFILPFTHWICEHHCTSVTTCSVPYGRIITF